METYKKITEELYYLGVQDRKISLFEAIYPVDEGISYNSYFLDDEKTVLFDTVDKGQYYQFFENLKALLAKRKLDYLIINHLEPDHSALIRDVINEYPEVKIVLNQKTKAMLYQFFEFDFDIENNFVVVKEGDSISTGKHKLSFYFAPMVHWPEVMVTYDETSKILFSADAFGSFGALSGNIFDDEVEFTEKIPEYRRYYTNIVGKYGPQVLNLLSKAKTLEIKMICPLHGLILRQNINLLIEKYSLWASYTPEINSSLIVYASVYGGTQSAAEILGNNLADLGVKNIKIIDVSKTHFSYILSEAFKYSHLVIATTTYNNSIFASMDKFLNDIVSHNLQNRKIAIIENGSWMPNAGSSVREKLSILKNTSFIESKITVKSTLKRAQQEELLSFAKEIAQSINC